MKKVLHYVGIMNRGGMETLIMNLYRNVDREKIAFDFATHTDKKGDFDDEIISLGGRIYAFPPYRKDPKGYKMAWRKFFNEHSGEYLVFHMHTNSLANITALLEAERAGVPVRITHSHSTFANKGRLQFLNNFLHKHNRKRLKTAATHLFACGQKAAEWLYGGMSLYGKEVTVINNGVSCAEYTYNAQTAQNKKKQLGVEGKKVVGHIGKFVTVKNHTFILKIICEMVKQNPDIVCLLIGDGELRCACEQEAKALGVEQNVRFLGVRSDIPELLMAMDLFLMPSLYEGLPVSMIEVQSSGLASLISDTISSEVKIKENVNFKSLSDGAPSWAEEAFKIMSQPRMCDNTPIINAGYDIEYTTKKYCEICNI